ncbi:10821_t:CDS:1, partial [Dentiscutata heterogama]
MSISPQSKLSSDVYSFMETESFQMDDMPLLAEDEALQNKSDESSVSEDCEEI